MKAKYIIYLIRVNKYIYVGCSINGHKREIHHRSLLNRNKHANKILQRSYNKNQHMHFFELKEFNSKESMYREEIKFINSFRRAGLFIANMTNGGEGTVGYQHTKTAKEKMSTSHKGKPGHINSLNARKIANAGNKYSAKKIKCIQTGEIFNSILEAAKKLKINYSTLAMATKNKSLTRQKLSFEYIRG